MVLGGSVDSTFGFSDDEGNEDTPQEMTETVSPEEDLVEDRRDSSTQNSETRQSDCYSDNDGWRRAE